MNPGQAEEKNEAATASLNSAALNIDDDGKMMSEE
jgi:hypothetical protein